MYLIPFKLQASSSKELSKFLLHHINFNFGDKYYILNIETGTETGTETETKIGQIGEAKKVDFSNFVN